MKDSPPRNIKPNDRLDFEEAITFLAQCNSNWQKKIFGDDRGAIEYPVDLAKVFQLIKLGIDWAEKERGSKYQHYTGFDYLQIADTGDHASCIYNEETKTTTLVLPKVSLYGLTKVLGGHTKFDTDARMFELDMSPKVKCSAEVVAVLLGVHEACHSIQNKVDPDKYEHFSTRKAKGLARKDNIAEVEADEMVRRAYLNITSIMQDMPNRNDRGRC